MGSSKYLPQKKNVNSFKGKIVIQSVNDFNQSI